MRQVKLHLERQVRAGGAAQGAQAGEGGAMAGEGEAGGAWCGLVQLDVCQGLQLCQEVRSPFFFCYDTPL